MRKFGFVSLHTKEEILTLPFIRNLGKEPLKDLSLKDFKNLLSHSNRAIKVLLLDQSKIAGIGNIYDCEALWIAGIRPQKPANSLRQIEIKKLFTAIEDVLREGILRGGASDNSYRNLFGGKGEYQNFFKVYGRTGKPCLRCQTPIIRVSLGGRGTFFCPKCQK
jgi:formamidopyrimidine-DNA glycosylase